MISQGWVLALIGAAVLSRIHPMHTSVAEITHNPMSRSADIRIRVFADDFGSAVAAPGDSAVRRYVRARFALADRTGRPLALEWLGAEPAGDVILLRLRAGVPDGLGGLRVASTLLCERFEDQVNVVRASYDGRSVTLLFTRGDLAKTLP